MWSLRVSPSHPIVSSVMYQGMFIYRPLPLAGALFVAAELMAAAGAIGSVTHVVLLVAAVIVVVVLRPISPVTPNPSPVVGTTVKSPLTVLHTSVQREKQIQTEILAVTRAVHSEAQLGTSLMALFAKHATSFNLIHIATILHRISVGHLKPDSLRSLPEWADFLTKAIELLTIETTNLKTATCVVCSLAKFGQTVDRDPRFVAAVIAFCERNAETLDSSMLIQLVTSLPLAPLESTISALMDQYATRIGPETSQQDLTFLFARNVPFDICIVEKFQQFHLDGIAQVLSGIDRRTGDDKPLKHRLVIHVLSHLSPLEELANGDKSDPMIVAAMERFFDLPHTFIREHLLSASHSSAIGTVLLASVERSIKATRFDPVRVGLALRILVANKCGQVRDTLAGLEKTIERFQAPCGKDTFDLLSVLAEMDAKFLNLYIACSPPIDSVTAIGKLLSLVLMYGDAQMVEALLPSFQEVLVADTTHQLSTSMVMAIIAGLTNVQSEKGDDVKKILTKMYTHQLERFIVKQPVDAFNTLTISSKPKRVESAVKVIKAVEKNAIIGSVVPALWALRHTKSSQHKRMIEGFIHQQLFFASPEIILKCIATCSMSKPVLQEISVRLAGNKVNFTDITSILNELLRNKNGWSLDELFQTLQTWLVPQIPKLTLNQISEISEVLERFEGRPADKGWNAVGEIMTP